LPARRRVHLACPASWAQVITFRNRNPLTRPKTVRKNCLPEKLLNSTRRPDLHSVLQLFGEHWGGQSRTKSSRQKQKHTTFLPRAMCLQSSSCRQPSSASQPPIAHSPSSQNLACRNQPKAADSTSTTNPRVIDSHLLVNSHLPKALPTVTRQPRHAAQIEGNHCSRPGVIRGNQG
jgi:hypothetical protein